MEVTERPSTTRAGVARTSQACQRCRNLKTRCLPGAQSERCQRCSSADKECVWADAPRRFRKLRAPSRIAQVEQKIDGLVAKLVNAPDSRSEPTVTPVDARPDLNAPGSWLPVVSFESEPTQCHSEKDRESSEADRQYLHELRSIHNFSDREDVSQVPAGSARPSKMEEAPILDELVQHLLSSNAAESLVSKYRRMSASFPFVVVPRGVSAFDLHASRPMLFLAILTVASWEDHARQRSLDRIYRQELANRTLMNPRKTLGLVQSVLVYLSWYHFVFSHKTQQIFFLHHLLIGLALDIGLHQDHQPLMKFPRPSNSSPPPPPPAEKQRERHRAFLGCYYLASMVAAGLQKPNLLKHTAHMAELAKGLRQYQEYESDETIEHLISLRSIDDQIQDTLFTGSVREMNLTDARTLMHMRFMAAQLEAWRKETSGAVSRRLLDLSSSFTEMLLHSVALRPQSTDQLLMSQSTIISALVSTLEAGKRFLDALLTFPAQEYHLISFCEWMRLPTVIMTVARLCMPTDAHVAAGWDFKAAQDRARLDLCLESMCYRMQSLSTYDKRTQPHPDFWYAMRFINDLTKTWYTRKIMSACVPSAQPTPSSGLTGQPADEVSDPSDRDISAPNIYQAGQHYNTPACINSLGDVSMDVERDTAYEYDSFAAMINVDLDMEQLLDMGIWSDESYIGMGFGGSGMNS